MRGLTQVIQEEAKKISPFLPRKSQDPLYQAAGQLLHDRTRTVKSCIRIIPCLQVTHQS